MKPIKEAPSHKNSVSEPENFDPKSGPLAERLLFNNRLWVLIICMIITIVLGFQASKLVFNTSYEKMLPSQNPYIVNYLENKESVSESGNAVRIAVENPRGTIYEAEYMDILRRMSDEVFLLPGVYRQLVKSLWTPNARWTTVVEQGLDQGPIIPDGYDGSKESLGLLQRNVLLANEVGQTVAFDHKSSIIYVSLLGTYADGTPIDYGNFSHNLEALRTKYEKEGVRVHIIGFPKVAGDLIAGLQQILFYFGAAILFTCLVVYWYTRCVRATAIVVICSLMAVVWQLGLLPSLGMVLDPYSILVPFLVFAIGISHGAQKMNGVMQDLGRGHNKLVAARFTFRRLFLPGLTALLSDMVGFAVLLVIQIGVIQELAISASIGVGVLIFTNLILVPIMLSYTGMSAKAVNRALQSEIAETNGEKKHFLWRFFDLFTERKWASIAIVCGLALALFGFWGSRDLRIGDLDPGAPELRPDSKYNKDNAFITENYGASSDVFGIMVKTDVYKGANLEALLTVDALDWELQHLEGVEYTKSLPLFIRRLQVALSDGNFKWYEIIPNTSMLGSLAARAPREVVNGVYSFSTLTAYLKDHKADTLTSVVDTVEDFKSKRGTGDSELLLAFGNAGIEAATNIVVKKANQKMLFWVYGAVIALCFVTFRSWRLIVVAVLPLMLTSVLAEAVMVWLGIGVKVSTLPVIALGVGVGVDYALYIMAVMQQQLNKGDTLSEAYYCTLKFTGKVVILIGITLAMGVMTWAFSPIKFQADMGVLLAFMFIWNMLGALILIPALSHFLLKPKKSCVVITEQGNESPAQPHSSIAQHTSR
ncbi:MAG: MMPL family transporter [Sedimentisphaerales bacterium]|nr:MMPL family transporter [Sedimentisphaerales bacterium]